MKVAQGRAVYNIQRLLDTKDMSLGTLASEAGIDKSNLSKMLRGRRQINMEHLSDIAKALEVDVQILLEPAQK